MQADKQPVDPHPLPLFRKVGVWRPVAPGSAPREREQDQAGLGSTDRPGKLGQSTAKNTNPNSDAGAGPGIRQREQPSDAAGDRPEHERGRDGAADARPHENVVEIRAVRDPAMANTRARRVDSRWNAFAAPCHVVTADGVLFCLTEDFVCDSTVWRAHYNRAPRELVVGESSDALGLVLRVWAGQRLDVLAGRLWPLAETLLGATYLCGRHGFRALYPLFTAYVQLLAYKTGEFAPLFQLGVHASEPAWIALAAVQLAQRHAVLDLAPFRGALVPRLASAYARLAALHDPLTGWKDEALPPEETLLAFLNEPE